MKTGWKKFKIISLTVIVVLNISTFFRIERIKRSMEDLNSQIYNVNSHINVDDITNTITDLLEKQNSIISDFKYDFNSFSDGKMSLSLKVLPKEYSTEATYYFSYLLKDGTNNRIKADVDAGNYLVADVDLPFREGVEINYIEEVGSERKMEKLDSIDTLEEELLQSFNVEESPSTIRFGKINDYQLLDNIYMISYTFNHDSFQADQGLERAEVYISLDGNIIDSFSMNKKKSISTSNREIYQYHFENYKLNFKKSDMIEVYAIATHSKGYKVKINLGQLYKDMDYGDEEGNYYPGQFEDMVTLIYED